MQGSSEEFKAPLRSLRHSGDTPPRHTQGSFEKIYVSFESRYDFLRMQGSSNKFKALQRSLRHSWRHPSKTHTGLF